MTAREAWKVVAVIAGFVVVWSALVGTLAFWSAQVG